MPIQRRYFLQMGAAALIASACTRRTQSPDQSITAASNDLKRVNHAFGETEIPMNPTRIVVCGYETVEAVVAHGVQPLGIPHGVSKEMSYLSLGEEAIAEIGSPNQPNLETIATLKPDLILTEKYRGADAYPLLSQIAPTVVFDIDGNSEWQKLTRLCGEVLGKPAETEALSTAYDAKLQQVEAQLSQMSKQPQVSVVRIFPGLISAGGTETFAGSVLTDAGISYPPHQSQAQSLQNISLESLDLLDGDVIFIMTLQSSAEFAQESRAEVERLKSHPLWSRLKAVQTNQVYEVGAHWAIGSYIAANLILDDLLKYGVGNL